MTRWRSSLRPFMGTGRFPQRELLPSSNCSGLPTIDSRLPSANRLVGVQEAPVGSRSARRPMPQARKAALIDETLARELENYKGRWVGIDKGRVVASGRSAREVLQAANRAGVTAPLVFRVSAHPERLSLF